MISRAMIARKPTEVELTRGWLNWAFIVTVAMGVFCALPIAGLAEEALITYEADKGRVLFQPGGTGQIPALDLSKLRGAFPVLVKQRNAWIQVEGHYLQSANTITFEPSFPFIPGVGEYRAVIDWQQLQKILAAAIPALSVRTEYAFQPPAITIKRNRVVSIFPDGMAVPENILRFYINFSGPMALGSLSESIRLETGRGVEVSAFFMDNLEPLWSRDRTRLTMLLDPARVKRGVLANRTLGRALRQGETYSLTIDSKMKDAAGNYLLDDFEWTFTVGAPIEMALNMDDVQVSEIKVETSEPIEILFPGIMNYFQLAGLITIECDGQDIVAGRLDIGRQPSSIIFTPELPWQVRNYVLRIASDAEDISGNTFLTAFDHDAGREVKKSIKQDQYQTRDLVLATSSYTRP